MNYLKIPLELMKAENRYLMNSWSIAWANIVSKKQKSLWRSNVNYYMQKSGVVNWSNVFTNLHSFGEKGESGKSKKTVFSERYVFHLYMLYLWPEPHRTWTIHNMGPKFSELMKMSGYHDLSSSTLSSL